MRSSLLASLLFAAGCSSAYADLNAPQAPGPRTAIAIAPDKIRAPYDVQVIRENGDTLPTYGMKDRFYVQGNIGERYTIRVTNPTQHRVEAVVSVDGLDVIDGQEGDLRKRGYIVPPGGDVRIEGFRTSLDDVATFRFSSVDGSYAGKQGKARNVGVIAVAIFEEQAQPEQQIVVGDNEPVAKNKKYDYSDDLADNKHAARDRRVAVKGADKAEAEAPAKKAKAYRPPADPAPTTTGAAGGAPATRPAPPPPHQQRMQDADDDIGVEETQAPATHRPGLGTEFGEQRYSGATYTRFVRAANRPIAIAELRYNDAAGLAALGINVQPMPDQGEIMTRETADPFPGDRSFSRAP